MSAGKPGGSGLLWIAGACFALFVIGFIGITIWGVTQGRDDTEVAATPTVVDTDTVTIDIEDFEFKPSNVSVPLNATVTWNNHDNAPHDATDDSNEWETERMDDDENASLTFDTPGTYDYHCSIHPYMKGRLTVRAD
jgi:plastocyanin